MQIKRPSWHNSRNKFVTVFSSTISDFTWITFNFFVCCLFFHCFSFIFFYLLRYRSQHYCISNECNNYICLTLYILSFLWNAHKHTHTHFVCVCVCVVSLTLFLCLSVFSLTNYNCNLIILGLNQFLMFSGKAFVIVLIQIETLWVN